MLFVAQQPLGKRTNKEVRWICIELSLWNRWSMLLVKETIELIIKQSMFYIHYRRG